MSSEEFAKQLARASDRICSRILHEDVDWIDVELDIEKMREFVRSHFPDRLDLFERLYVGRFQRLWEQWHDDVRSVYDRFD